jgi:hypothetical protein
MGAGGLFGSNFFDRMTVLCCGADCVTVMQIV